MDAKTLKALEGSIKKWEKIVAGKGCDRGSNNCPLCKMFIRNQFCDGCPVANYTGKDGCQGTPYASFDWSGESTYTSRGYKVAGPKSLQAAKDMVAFLKRLRPRKKAIKRVGNAK